MVFSSIVFLFAFLPLLLILYYLCPLPVGNGLLLLVSLVFYSWGQPKHLWLMLVVIAVNYVAALLMELLHKKEKKGALPVCLLAVCVTLSFLAYFKYAGFVTEILNDITKGRVMIIKAALPIGISFYTFQTLGYTIDVYKGKVKAHKNPFTFALFVTMFPQLIAGPIVSYRDVAHDLDRRNKNLDQIMTGITRFVIGLAKKVLLANQVGKIFTEVSGYAATGLGPVSAWLGALAFTFQIYFDFSGYSDMAIGLGHMFGFHFPENFNYPYEADSITEFWRRWHMTLSHWFRDYVYIPLGGNRKGVIRQIINLAITWFLTGLWHGAAFNFMLWGMYYFVLLMCEKLFLLKWLEKWPKLLARLYTFFLVTFGWVIFACVKMKDLGQYIKALFGMGGTDGHAFHILLNSLPLLILCFIASRSAITETVKKGLKEKPATALLLSVYLAVLLLLSTAFLISDSYNPFLYFRF